MSYIGNPIVSTDFPVDYASGNGSTTAFTLSIAPASVNAIDVQISGVTQSPQTYTLSGTTLTFSAAPPSGTNNIVVRHRGVAGTPNVPAVGSVVNASIADATITAAKFAAGQTPSFNGIAFPATQSASTDANTLDDYEEGTFTVTVTCSSSGSVTPSPNTGSYTKIGRLVVVTGYLEFTSVSSPVGYLRLNLPFTVANGSQFESAGSFMFNNVVSANVSDFVATLNNNTSTFDIYLGNGTVVSATSANQIKANTSIRFEANYMTS